MPAARAEEVERFALVMVHPTREADGSLTHILHTLLPDERPIEVRRQSVIVACLLPWPPFDPRKSAHPTQPLLAGRGSAVPLPA